MIRVSILVGRNTKNHFLFYSYHRFAWNMHRNVYGTSHLLPTMPEKLLLIKISQQLPFHMPQSMRTKMYSSMLYVKTIISGEKIPSGRTQVSTILLSSLRADVSKYRELVDKHEVSDFFISCLDNLFCDY